MLIISLTSFPARIDSVTVVINSLLKQTYKADKIILWLGKDQFPNHDKDLPDDLLDLCKKGLEIQYVKDIRSYTKLIPALQKYPDATIITVDDDIVYGCHMVEKLVREHKKHPQDILCHRITKFSYEKGKFYTTVGGHDYWRGASYLNKLTGVGGVLYPPHCLHREILDEKLFKDLAPTNDDLWFWCMAVLNGTGIRVVKRPEYVLHYVPNTQEVGLCQINDNGPKLFWVQLNNLLNYYPEFKNKLIAEQKKHLFYSVNLPNGRRHYWLFNVKILSWRFKKKSDPNKKYDAIYAKRFKKLTVKEIKYILKYQFKRCFGYDLDIDNPKTFNEKIQWLKLYYQNPLLTVCADKVAVREYVKNTIGEKYLVPVLGIYDNVKDIDFDKLPDKFALKVNWGSGQNIIVTDKSKLDIKDARNKLKEWMKPKGNHYFNFLEWAYKNIPPKIIAESFIESEKDLVDYKFCCYNGHFENGFIATNRALGHEKLRFNWVDRNFKQLPFERGYPAAEKLIQKPKQWNEMIKLAETLAKPFPFVRVDLYVNDNEIKFGEMTFYPGNGMEKFTPPEWDSKLGELIDLPNKVI